MKIIGYMLEKFKTLVFLVKHVSFFIAIENYVNYHFIHFIFSRINKCDLE